MQEKKYCRNCGAEVPKETKFCPSCGSKFEQVPSTQGFCTKCGASLPSNVRFCTRCGAPVAGTAQPGEVNRRIPPAAQPVRQNTVPITPKSQVYVPPEFAQRNAERKQAVESRKTQKRKFPFIQLGCVILVLALVFTGFVQPGFFLKRDGSGGNPATMSSSDDGWKSTGLKGGSKQAELLKASPENLSVSGKDGVTVVLSPFLFDYDEEREVSVRSAGTEKATNGDWQLSAYDIGFDDLHELDTFIDIRLPYDGTFCDAGEDPAECVGAKYYNETSGKWEDILYEVDEAAHEVVIHTDHLSRFACFEVRNAGLRRAYITEINEKYINLHVDLNTAAAALSEYAAKGGSGEKCYKIGELTLGEIFGDVLLNSANKGNDFVGNTGSALQLSDLFFYTEKYAKINESFWKKMGMVGMALSAVNIIVEFSKPNQTDGETLTMVKDLGMFLLSATAETSLGIGLVGVSLIDKAITDFGNAAQGYVAERIDNIYVYYNDIYCDASHKARTSKDWRDIVAKAVKDSGGDENVFRQLLEDNIDEYARRFFNGPIDTISWEIQADFAEHFSGARVGVITKDQAEPLIKKYKERMYQRLSGAILKEQQKDYEYKVMQRYLASLEAVKDELNNSFTVNIREAVDEGKSPAMANYIVRFSPLSSYASANHAVESWTGKLNRDGAASTAATVIGYIIAGAPNTLDVYEPGSDPDSDKPVMSVSFSWNYPTTEIILGSPTTSAPDWINGPWSEGQYDDQGSFSFVYSRNSVRITLLDDHTLLWEKYLYPDDNPDHPSGVDYAFEREYYYDPKTDSFFIQRTETGQIIGNFYTWSDDHLDPYCITRMPDKDEQGMPAAKFTCNPKELTGKDTGSVVTMRYNRNNE